MSSWHFIDVEVDLDDFSESDLRQGGLVTTTVEVDLSDFDDSDLIEELQERNYTVVKDAKGWVHDSVFKLYQEWLADEGDNDRRFDKALRAFFSEHLDKNV